MGPLPALLRQDVRFDDVRPSQQPSRLRESNDASGDAMTGKRGTSVKGGELQRVAERA